MPKQRWTQTHDCRHEWTWCPSQQNLNLFGLFSLVSQWKLIFFQGHMMMMMCVSFWLLNAFFVSMDSGISSKETCVSSSVNVSQRIPQKNVEGPLPVTRIMTKRYRVAARTNFKMASRRVNWSLRCAQLVRVVAFDLTIISPTCDRISHKAQLSLRIVDGSRRVDGEIDVNALFCQNFRCTWTWNAAVFWILMVPASHLSSGVQIKFVYWTRLWLYVSLASCITICYNWSDYLCSGTFSSIQTFPHKYWEWPRIIPLYPLRANIERTL